MHHHYIDIRNGFFWSDGSQLQNTKLIIDKSYEANLSKCAIDF